MSLTSPSERKLTMLFISSCFVLLFTLPVKEVISKFPGFKNCVVLFMVGKT